MSTIPSITRALTAICDAVRAVEACEKMFQAQDAGERGRSILHQASVVNRLVSLGFTIAEVGLLLKGTKNEALSKLKDVELLPKVVDFSLSFTLEASSVDGSWRSVVRCVEKGLVGPLADIVRVSAEGQAYMERHYLAMSPEELKTAQRPIYEVQYQGRETTWTVVGYKPVDLNECRQNLEKLEGLALGAAVVRGGAQAGVAEAAVARAPLYERLLAYFVPPGAAAPLPVAALPGIPAVLPAAGPAPVPPITPIDAVRALNLAEFSHIPDPLHNDDLFRQFICPITQEPIRDPVMDPTNHRTLYERRAITTFLRISATSPMTRLPLTAAELEEVPAVRLIIDRRLEHHRDGLVAYLQAHTHDPISAADQAVIAAHT